MKECDTLKFLGQLENRRNTV